MKVHALPDGRRLRYELRRQGGGPVVVFLNGLSQTTIAWGLQVKRLRGVRDVLLYDASGQGKSDPPPEGSRTADHGRDLLHLLDTLELDQVDLVGFSFGSRVALRVVLAAPERVRRLVLIGCAHRETALRRWIVQGWLDALDAGGQDLLFQVVTPDVVGEEWLRENEQMREQMLRAFRRRNDPESMRRMLLDTLLPGGDFGEELKSVRAAALVIRGVDDPLVPRFLNDELVDLLPDTHFLEVERCGHTVAVERPSWLAERMREHLTGTESDA